MNNYKIGDIVVVTCKESDHYNKVGVVHRMDKSELPLYINFILSESKPKGGWFNSSRIAHTFSKEGFLFKVKGSYE